MSSKKEESEKFIKSESTPNTSLEKEADLDSSTTSTNDICSDSGDLLASWTFVNDKENNKSKDESDDHINILKKSEGEETDVGGTHDGDFDEDEYIEDNSDVYLEDSLHKYTYDDVSDGISIISDSDSLDDRAPYKKDLEESKLRDTSENGTELEDADLINDSVMHRRNEPFLKQATKCVLKFSYDMTKRGLSCALYVGIGVALLGFLGNIWQPFSAIVQNCASVDQLQQKFNDMELQNNLMRAEIDLLTKQVKYLSSYNDNYQQKSVKYKVNKDDKTFKAWAGNGDSLQPVDITKDELKNPYKCPDGSFAEIANMCVERQSANDPSIIDQFGQVVGNLKDKSEAFTAFEQVAEEMQGFQDNLSAESYSHKHHKNGDKNKNEYKKFSGKDYSREWKKSEFSRRGSSEIHGDDNSNDWQEKRMKSREKLRHKYQSDEDDDDDDSGEWHAKLMNNRVQQRRKTEHKDQERYDVYKKYTNRENQRNGRNI